MSWPEIGGVLGAQIGRARREHKLSVSILAMLAGLSEQQVQAIESGSDGGFVNEAHRVDCARRIAVALGLPGDHFLQPPESPPTAAAAVEAIPRAQWQHLPLASLDLLAGLPACALPPAPEQRRQGSPMLVALALCVLLALLLLGLAALH